MSIILATVLLCHQSPNKASADQLVELARQSIKNHVLGRPTPEVKTSTPSRPVFVTIEVGTTIRGCRGSLETFGDDLESAVAAAAIEACAFDPKYKPLTKKELDNFKVTVTVVHQLEAITDVRTLLPSEGLVLQSGSRVGIVLPWEGKDPQVRLGWAYRKANVSSTEAVVLKKLIGERTRG